MFDNIPGFDKLEDNIYVYHNFVLSDELDQINNDLDCLEERLWHKFENRQHNQSPELASMIPVLDRLNAVVPNGFSIVQHTSINRLSRGESWGIHSDNAEFIDIRNKSKTLAPGEPFQIVDNTVYGIVIYFNQFDGGELFYTKKNFLYKPSPGDLVIHGAEEDCEHMVKKVLSDKRYSYSNSIRETIKIPIK